MKAKDLLLTDLLEFEPKGGVIRFGGSRALIFDAVALGLRGARALAFLLRGGAARPALRPVE